MQPSFGSGSPLLGGTSPLAQVMAQGGSPMNQQSPASAGFQPFMQPPTPPTSAGTPQISAPQPQGQPLPPEMAGVSGLPAETPESQLIIKALSERLRQLGKMGQ